MDKSRRKIRTCLIWVAVAAIVVGLFYYYYSTQNQTQISEGVLIIKNMVRTSLWQ